MKGKSPSFLKVLGFSHWESASSMWKCKCICGRIVNIDIRRLRDKKRGYKSCGCLRDSNSKTYFYAYRRKFFERIKKKGPHWHYETASKNRVINCCFRKKYQSIQRLAYIFWNHLYDIPKGFEVSNSCNVRTCVKPSHLRMLSKEEGQKIRIITRFKNQERKNGKNI